MISFASTGIHGLVTGPPPRFRTDEDGDNPETENFPGMGQGPELNAVMRTCLCRGTLLSDDGNADDADSADLHGFY